VEAAGERGDHSLECPERDVRVATFNIGNFGLADAGEFGYVLLCPASKPTKVGHALGDPEADVVVESELSAGLGEKVTD